MDSNTEVKDYWIIDRDYSNNLEDSYKNRVISDALNSEIKKRAESLLEFDTMGNYEVENNPFWLPDLFRTPNPYRKNYFTKSQNWVGQITELSDTEFTAKLIDKNDQTTFEVAQFDMDEISKGDMELIKLGAIFYWSVGFANQNGQISKQSLIRFKRSVALSISEFDYITDQASELSEKIHWD